MWKERGSGTLGAVRRWGAQMVVRPLEERLTRIVRAEVERAVSEIERAVSDVQRAVWDVEFRSRRDLLAAGERGAALSSATWARRVMPTAREFHDPVSTLEYALE